MVGLRAEQYAGGGLYKSTDGGDTWKQLAGGLPADEFVGKIGIAVAPSNPNRLWAVVDESAALRRRRGPAWRGRRAARSSRSQPAGGVYISDDAGATWKLVNSREPAVGSRGWYFESVAVDPANPDRAYVINTATYMTTDAGKTFVPGQGRARRRRLSPALGQSQGRQPHGALAATRARWSAWMARKTWSTWYNQPTAQIYHVAADNRFPYWLYGAQQDSGGVGVSTWSREGVLSFRNWEPTCLAGESNTVVPDPKDGNILYGGGAGRCDQALTLPLRSAANCLRPIPTIPTARPGRCRRSSRRPMKRSITPISSSCARAIAARPGKRSAPIWRA